MFIVIMNLSDKAMTTWAWVKPPILRELTWPAICDQINMCLFSSSIFELPNIAIHFNVKSRCRGDD